MPPTKAPVRGPETQRSSEKSGAAKTSRCSSTKTNRGPHLVSIAEIASIALCISTRSPWARYWLAAFVSAEIAI